MENEVGGTCGTRGKVYRVLVAKPEGKRPLGKPRRRWEHGIRMNFRKIGWGSVGWIQLAQNRDRCRAVVNTVMNLRVLEPLSYFFKIIFLYNDRVQDNIQGSHFGCILMETR
jgi:hypothetical protein